MVQALTRAILQSAPAKPCTIAPCIITQVSPLQISVNGGTNIPAVKIAGATYALGPANALLCPPSQPIVLPIG